MSSVPAKSSRWGSFLSSVESRLDTILAEDDPKASKRPTAKVNEQSTKTESVITVAGRPASPSRSATGNRAQDRLNEKLARAMANKNLAKKGDNTPMSSGLPSRSGSPANAG